MRITAIVERPVTLHGAPANAVVDFSGHTVSLVAVRSDVIRAGKPATGVAFDSIGRFAQSGILRDRMIPSVLDHRRPFRAATRGGGRCVCRRQLLPSRGWARAAARGDARIPRRRL